MADHIESLVEDAIALLRGGENARARTLAERALALEPSRAEAKNAMGLVETADQEHEAARRHYAAAVAAAPDNAAYKVNLGYSYVLTGEFERAREEFDRALALDPDNASAYQNIVWITKIRPGDPIIDALGRLKAKLQECSDDFIKVAYARGKCLDDIGDYDAAFAEFRAANECRPSRYDRRRHEMFFSDVKTVWTDSFLNARRAEGFKSPKPVFIVGMPRTGSTLLEEKLSARADVVALGEIPDIISMAGAMSRAHPRRAEFPHWCVDAPSGAFGGLGRLYVEKFERKHPAAERFINKALLNFAYAGMIAAMLPEALIVESRRNPVDACLSCYFKDLKEIHHYAVRLDTLGHLYRLYADVMAHWRATLENFLTVAYEAFIGDADGATRRLHAAMGLSGDAAGSEPGIRPIQTFSAWQVRQPIYPESAGRWRNYEKHIGPLVDALGDLA